MTVWLSARLTVCGDICGDTVFGDATQEWCPRSLPCPALSGPLILMGYKGCVVSPSVTRSQGALSPCCVPHVPGMSPCPASNTSPLCLNGFFIWERGGGLMALPGLSLPASATVQQALPAWTLPGNASTASWALQGSTDHGDPTEPHTSPGARPPNLALLGQVAKEDPRGAPGHRSAFMEPPPR